ncbi:MAG TPA: PHP domain-containing protein [Gemmatimonadaceae bacterium]|nr:PHP domain-containing protein [Gemmatimonadaceae bacterium]
MHSTASDGSLAPGAVVGAAAAASLVAIALTDHDTVAGVAAACEAGAQLGVRVVAGVELSAVDGGAETHLLGVHLARLDAIERHLVVFRETRRERAGRIVERLHALGIPLPLDAVLAEAGQAAIGRPHVARALVAGGFARDIRDAFDRLLGNGRPAFAPKHRLSVGEAIGLVHEAGGLAVLAHPGAGATRERLDALRALGLDGVEVLHPGHSAEDIARITTLADHLDLVPSGGSDWHGAKTGPRVIGSMRVPETWLARQDERTRALAAHVA